MNKLGFSGLLKVMVAVTILILALAFAGPLKFHMDTVRNSTTDDSLGLNCVNADGSDNSTLDDFQKANCASSDLLLPFFTFILIGLAGAIIVARIVIQ